MLIGKLVAHEYRGRGTIVAIENGEVTVRFGADYDVKFPYPMEFDHMLSLRDYDPEAQQEIDAAIRADRLRRVEAYRKEKEARAK